MPTVLRWKGYRFYFWSGDRKEPPHVHVRKGRSEAKIWLQPVAVAKAVDVADHELNEIVRKIEDRNEALLEAWHDHFGY